MSDKGYGLTLSAAPPLRRGSTPLPIKHQLKREEAVSEDYDWTPGHEELARPLVSVSAQEEPPGQAPQDRYHGPLRIVLLGQNGVGKSSLALLLAGQSDRSLSLDSESSSEEGYQRRVTLDDEDSTILIYDNWKQDLSTLQCEVCILVFSLTDRRSFHRTSQIRLLLRETQPHTPIILVGNKSDLVRSREISTEEAQTTAAMLDSLYLELSASLDHRTSDLLDGAVRLARGHSLGPDWPDGPSGGAGGRRESLTSRAKRFLSGLVPRAHGGRERDRDRERERDLSRHRGSRMMRQKSRSCHDLSSM
ncbi:GTP-binding protein REM 2 isoform X2 [Clupea harengus]|uniref:GTP-binding protein REM 2 isoform X2 n=1 Tax=Clupea harengus TaxID=7950 RepID=A0A6P8EJP2_CLUHA|nr:GTP-binding protein REM 2 isoform X2 [Clupea harengus]